MRTSPLRDAFAGANARFEERAGVEIVSSVYDPKTEYHFVRDAVGVTDFSFVQKYRVPEATAIDFLDPLLAGNVPKTRFGRVLHTFLADNDGRIIADCYVANNDEEFILLCESIVDDAALDAIFSRHGAQAAQVTTITDDFAAISIDGSKAWEVTKALFGADVLGLPYLSIETYAFGSEKIRLFRTGKTSEFGYLLLAPRKCAAELLSAVKEQAFKSGGGLCGVSVHNGLRLEGRFFNIHAEGKRVGDPLSLGLQWMIDFEKGKFAGSDAILQRRSEGLKNKIIGVRTMPGEETLVVGKEIFSDGKPVATVVADCFSYTLNCRLGLALFPVSLAYSGLEFKLGSAGGPSVYTISMPPIMPKSLTIKLDEM